MGIAYLGQHKTLQVTEYKKKLQANYLQNTFFLFFCFTKLKSREEEKEKINFIGKSVSNH